MPGYLGSEKQFIRRYQKPLIASSRDRDLEHGTNRHDQLAESFSHIHLSLSGQLAMDILHKQIKPFMLRRLKSDVLDDLPPKILQDYFCDLSSIQCLLYEDFANQTKQQASFDESQNQNVNSATNHVFKVRSFAFVRYQNLRRFISIKALQYLRKLCNHPSLVLTSTHPKWSSVQSELKESQMALNDIRLSGKLLALR